MLFRRPKPERSGHLPLTVNLATKLFLGFALIVIACGLSSSPAYAQGSLSIGALATNGSAAPATPVRASTIMFIQTRASPSI